MIIKVITTITSSNENYVIKRRKKMLEKIAELVADQLGIDAADVKLESNFKEDLNADSLDLFELIMALEEEYGVEIPSEDLENILTVQDVIKYIEDHQ